MKQNVVAYLGKQNPLMLAAAGALVIGALYYFARKAIADVGAVATAAAETVASVATGNNAITRGATNADGVPVSAYEGAGILGTLGAATNAVSGGWFATAGEHVGSWAFRLLHSDD